jgi:DNA-directed RNA polymerase subunit beta
MEIKKKLLTHLQLSKEQTNLQTSTKDHQFVQVKKLKKVTVLVDASTSHSGQIALGQNALVAFMTWNGNNYEDAIIMSERLARGSKFTSIHIEEFVCMVRETNLVLSQQLVIFQMLVKTD